MLLTMIWTYVFVPLSWLHPSITCLYISGSLRTAKTIVVYLCVNVSLIPANIITKRLKEAYETNTNDSQFGCRGNRSTTDAIFILRSVTNKYNIILIAVYVHLAAADDHIPRDCLVYKMTQGITASTLGMKQKVDVLVEYRQGGQES